VPGDGVLLAKDRLPDVTDAGKRLFTVMSSTLATSLFRGVFRRGANCERMPLYRRAQYYEPRSGVNCILFHRTRILLRYWRIAMRESKGMPRDLPPARRCGA
jgi:hypothetical protein